MSPYRKQAILALAILVVLIGILAVSSDFYPILTVNGSPVSARRFGKNYRAADFYQENLLKTYGQDQTSEGSLSGRDLEVAVLNQLVEAELTAAGVKREVGGDLDYMVAGKVEKYDASEDLKNATMSLYGMSYPDFRKEVLVPQAKRDILAGRLYLREESIEDWLSREKQAARVTVFSGRFHWDGKQIVADD